MKNLMQWFFSKVSRKLIKSKFRHKLLNWLLLDLEEIPENDQISIGVGTYGIKWTNLSLPNKGDKFVIGKYCSIASGVKFYCGVHPTTSVSTYPLNTLLVRDYINKEPNVGGSIFVGNDVWIGANAIILTGVTIGDGAIIGAGAIVNKDVESYTIVGGVPAKFIKRRFSVEQAKQLTKIKWWNWSEEKIINNIDCFYNSVDMFIEKFKC
jgi:virginiamycin A acetyltransferase